MREDFWLCEICDWGFCGFCERTLRKCDLRWRFCHRWEYHPWYIKSTCCYPWKTQFCSMCGTVRIIQLLWSLWLSEPGYPWMGMYYTWCFNSSSWYSYYQNEKLVATNQRYFFKNFSMFTSSSLIGWVSFLILVMNLCWTAKKQPLWGVSPLKTTIWPFYFFSCQKNIFSLSIYAQCTLHKHLWCQEEGQSYQQRERYHFHFHNCSSSSQTSRYNTYWLLLFQDIWGWFLLLLLQSPHNCVQHAGFKWCWQLWSCRYIYYDECLCVCLSRKIITSSLESPVTTCNHP